MSLRHMTIGQKLTAAFSLLCLMIMMVGGFSLLQFSRMNDNALAMTDNILPSIELATDIRDVTTVLRRFEIGYLLVRDNPARLPEYQKSIDAQPGAMEKLFADYEKMIHDEEELRLFNQLRKEWQHYLNLHDRVWQHVRSREYELATDLLLDEGYLIFNRLHQQAQALLDRNHEYAKEERTVVVNAYDSARVGILLAILTAIALVIGLATLLTGQIRNPLIMITEQAKRIADGNLGRGELCEWLEQGRLNRDEIGQLALTIRRMKEGLATLVGEVSGSVNQLASAVEEVSAISEQSSQSMRQQQGEITQMATAMQQMQSTSREVARNTTDAAGAAKGAFDASHDGSKVVGNTISQIEQVAADIEQAGQVVNQLEAESNNISLVLDVIRGIADQTNLLALNAAIEAARAGEQGRGFAVVADEVRTLAQRTQDSTTEINRMIAQLQAQAAAAGSAMQEGCKRMLETVVLARDAGSQIGRINEAVTHINDMNAQIAGATEEQQLVAADLGRNMESINAVADENAQGAQHTAQACQELAQLAQSLHQCIARFRLA